MSETGIVELPGIECDESAYLVPEVRRRCTASQAHAIESKRDLVVLCAAAGMPLDRIEKEAKLSRETIEAIVASAAQNVRKSTQEHAETLRGLGRRWWMLARLRESEVPFDKLVAAASLATQRASELLVSGEVDGEKFVQEAAGDRAEEIRSKVLQMLKSSSQDAVECTPASPDGAAAKSASEASAGPVAQRATDGVSDVMSTVPKSDVGLDVGRGGGSGASGPVNFPIADAERGISGRGFKP